VALAAGETGVGIGVGAYDGQSAIGIGLGHVTRGGTQLNLGVSAATGGKAALRAGLGWKW
jgi:autotransporter adhesin